MKKLFKGGNVYDSDKRCFMKTDVLIDDDVIVSVSDNHGPGDVSETVDCEGKYLIPGLVDVHTHGRVGHDFNRVDERAVIELRRSYAEAGTTTLMATLASAPLDDLFDSADVINKQRETTPGLATIAGIHLEGRYLNPKKRGAHNIDYLSSPDDGMISALIDRMCPLPVHVSAAPELDPTGNFIKTVIEKGATFGIAHTDATFEEASAAVSRGAVSFTHTFNAMRPIHHREPGATGCSLLSDSSFSEFICDGEHIHPEMIKLASRIKPAGRIVLITDSMEAAGSGDGEYEIGGLHVTVTGGRALTDDGALAGSTLDLFTAVRNYMRFTGKPLEDVLPSATVNPASMVGIEKMCGRILPGLRADIIIISDKEDPQIDEVYSAGAPVRVLRDRRKG